MNTKLKNVLRPALRAGCVAMEALNGFRTDPNGYLPNRIRMLAGNYESDVCKILAESLPKDGVFVDIGANVGYISRYILTNSSPSKVISIEANPCLMPYLKSNLSRFDKVEIHSVALSDSTGMSVLYAGKDSAVGSLSKGYASEHHSGDTRWISEVKPIDIRTITGDSLFATLSNIDLVKIDIEGHEISALTGMCKMLKNRQIHKILFEFSPLAQRCAGHSPCDLIEFLICNGFSIHEAEGVYQGSPVVAKNVSVLVNRLGDRGYTSLMATLD